MHNFTLAFNGLMRKMHLRFYLLKSCFYIYVQKYKNITIRSLKLYTEKDKIPKLFKKKIIKSRPV